MKMRRVLAVVLAGILAASGLVGCGKSESKGNGGDKKKIEIKYLKGGLGEDWIKAVIKGFEKKYPEYQVVFESSAAMESVISAYGIEDTDQTDLYFCTKEYNTEFMEPLDDVLNATADGDTKTIKEKFNPQYLELEKATDGKYYQLTLGGGMIGIVYNKALFEKAGINVLPRTTDELVLACDTLVANNVTPFCHFKPVGYWELYMLDVFFMQYDGYDYVRNKFYACVDDNGNSPSLDVFTKKDGRYAALEAMSKIITPDNVLRGSNTYDHIIMQTKWLEGECAMMLTGSWVENEMKTTAGVKNFEMMKTPVISSITDKLTTVKTDAQLRKVVSAIDKVTNGEKKAEDYKQGENYVVENITVSAKDWDYIRAARNTMSVQYPAACAYIPTYAAAKEGAKEFLKYLYSDEGYKIYMDSLHMVMPLSLCEGEVDTTDWSDFEKNQLDIYNTTEQYATEYIMSKHKIFPVGGATKWGGMQSYVDKFCSNNEAERLSAKKAWDTIIGNIESNYKNNWIENIK